MTEQSRPAVTPAPQPAVSAPATEAASEDAPKKLAPATRLLADYLRAIRALMGEASAVRKPWIREVGLLMQQSRRPDPPPDLAAAVRRSGDSQRQNYLRFIHRLAELQSPPTSDACHTAMRAWLEKHLAACDLMTEVGDGDDLPRLRPVQALLAEARRDADTFGHEYNALVAALKYEAASRREARRRRTTIGWPFRRPN